MARKNREWYPGATYHVMSRGIRKTAIFKYQIDDIFFLKLMGEVKERYPFKLHAICLMTNHFHMEIETEDIPIWLLMQKILSSYASYYNQRHSYKGHLYEDRYTSSLIKDEVYFLEVSRYIHLNPVKARMVRDPLSYEYSSYGLFVQETGNKINNKFLQQLSGLVETDRTLSAFGHDSRQQYRMFVEGKLSHAEQELLIMKDMNEDEMWLPW